MKGKGKIYMLITLYYNILISIIILDFKDTDQCEFWTWFNQENPEIQNCCSLFSAVGEETEFPEVISGPRSCVCSDNFACSTTDDNLVRNYQNIIQVS